MRVLLASLALMFALSVATAQGTTSPAAADSTGRRWLSLDNVDLVQTFDKKLVTMPAAFSYTRSVGVGSSTAINAAMRYNVPANEAYAIGPTLEAAVNSALAKPQHQIKGGLTGDLMFRSNSATATWILPVTFGLERTHDGELRSDGWMHQAQMTVAPNRHKSRLWLLSNQEFGLGPDGDRIASIVLTPYVGVEYQGSDSADVKRNAWRGKASYSLNVKPFSNRLRERLTTTATAEQRKDWMRTGYEGDGWNRWFIASGDFILFSSVPPAETHTAAIGITYKKGANPADAFRRQEVTEIVFKIQY